MTKEKQSGYDMKDTLNWYARNSQELRDIGPSELSFLGKMCWDTGEKDERKISLMQRRFDYGRVENPELAQLDKYDIENVLFLFPDNAVDRSILDKIIWKSPLWFSKASLEQGKPIPTTNYAEAISPTAIIPGFTDYYLDKSGKLRASIELYQLNKSIPDSVRRAVNVEALAHEFAHTIIAPSLYGKQKLRLPDGKLVEGEEFLMDIGMKAEKRIPISHYAEAYRDVTASDGLPFRIIDGDKKTAISEELAETIAEIVLPFALYNPQQITNKDSHLGNRREIVSGLEAFLNAQEI